METDARITARELEIIEYLVVGATASEAASALKVSVHTVRAHIRNLYNKLGVANRIELLRWTEQHSDTYRAD